MRITRTHVIVGGAVTALVAVSATGQVVPAVSATEAKDRLWLAARASAVTSYLGLVSTVLLGIVLSHPRNRGGWKISKHVFPWHETLSLFVLTFLVVHVAALVADPYAGVGIGGALFPGLSSYRTVPVAVGVIALYATILETVTARFTRLLPSGRWLTVHRVSAAVLIASWAHGVLAGSDTGALWWMYAASGALVVLVAAWRYWVADRPASSTTEVTA